MRNNLSYEELERRYAAAQERVRALERAIEARDRASSLGEDGGSAPSYVHALRYRQLVDATTDAIYLMNERGELVDVNRAACDMLGYSREEILQLSIEDIDGCFTREDFQDFWGERPLHHSFLFDTNHRRKDGVLVHVEVNGHKFEADGEILLFGIARDTTERNEAAFQLQESENRFRTVFENLPGGVFAHDMDGRFVLVNEAACRCTGYSREELLAMSVSDIDPGSVSRDDRSHIWQTLRQGEAVTIESTQVRKDGSRYAVEVHLSAITLGGRPVILPIVVDVTERRQAQEALERSQQCFERMLDLVPDMISFHDPDMNIVYSNWNGFGRVAKEERVLGAKCYKTYRGFDAPCPDCQAGKVLQTKKPFQMETRLPDGTWIDLRVIPLLDAEGNVELFMEWVRDITQRKRAEEELVRSQKTVSLNHRIARIFLTASPDNLYGDVLEAVVGALESRFGYFGYVDDDGDLVCPSMTRDVWKRCQVPEKSIVFPRDSWSGLWGRSLIERRTLIQNEGLRLPEGHVELACALVAPIVHRGELIGQFAVADKPGGYTKDDAALLEGTAEQTAPVLHALLDRERQREVRQGLEEQLRQSQKMESVGQLAGGVAHDFNNILQVIAGSTELADMDLETAHPAREAIEQISKATERAAELVSQLLLFSRRQVMRPEVLDLNEVVSGLLKMLGRLIGEHIQLNYRPGPAAGAFRADRGMIEQVLMNLAVNARDAMPDGGTLTIATSREELDEEKTAGGEALPPGPYLTLQVADTGCGMDEEVAQRAFEPFFTTKEVGKGTGLGLATVYGTVRQHGGMISLRSERGKGTSFLVRLPEIAAHDNDRVPEDMSPTQGGTETILLAEDDESVRTVARILLERAGYRVLAARDGHEAVAMFSDLNENIDLLVLDVQMPRMGGRQAWETINEIRAGVPALFASGYSENVIQADFLEKNGLTMVGKPFKRSALLRAVREALDRPAPLDGPCIEPE